MDIHCSLHFQETPGFVGVCHCIKNHDPCSLRNPDSLEPQLLNSKFQPLMKSSFVSECMPKGCADIRLSFFGDLV